VINRRNGCGTTLFKKGLTENLSNDEINIVTIAVKGCGSAQVFSKNLIDKSEL